MKCRLSWTFKCSFLEDHKTAKVPFKYLHKEALLQPKFVVWRGDPRCIPKREVIQHIYWSLKEPGEQQFSSVSAVEWGLSHWPPLVHVLHDTVPAWNNRFDNMRKAFRFMLKKFLCSLLIYRRGCWQFLPALWLPLSTDFQSGCTYQGFG